MVCWPNQLTCSSSDKSQADHVRVCSLILGSKEQVSTMACVEAWDTGVKKVFHCLKHPSPMAFHTLSFYFKVIEFFLKKAEKDGNLNTTAAFFFFKQIG